MNRHGHSIDDLLDLMARLRDPKDGCPWDIAQSFATIAPHTVEEAYEVAEAIRTGDMAALCEELGDLLFQIVFFAQMAREAGHFEFTDIVRAITDKMIRRHPHVFGDASIATAAEQTAAWEKHKAAERGAGSDGRAASALGGVTLGLPGLSRAVKLQDRAARVGFDWPDLGPVLAKLEEEIGELRAEIDAGADPGRSAAELGDVLFVCANVARHLRIDPEAAVRGANAKFERRFRAIETALAARGKTPAESTLAEMDAIWNAERAADKSGR